MKFFNKLFPRAGKTCRQKKDYGILNKERTSRSPLISVVVTSYNYAAYIGQTLDSIWAQTYPNFEVIIVDDGSTDESIAVVERYLTDKRFHLYTHPGGVNKGLCATMKLGIEKSQGEYVAFCESDDLWKPQYLEKKVEIINAYQDVGIISNSIESFGDAEVIQKRIGYLNAVDASLVAGGNKVDLSREKSVNYIPTFSAVMIRKDILTSLDYHSPVDAWIDFWLYRQILRKHLLFYTNEKLTSWRMHNSLNGLKGMEKHVRKCEYFIDQSDRLLGIKPSSDWQLQQIRNSAYWDEAYYKAHYGHLLEGVEPVEHYYYWGWKESCNPSASFSNDAYLNYYMDMREGKINPLVHYESAGRKEKRRIFAVDEWQDTPITAEYIKQLEDNRGKNILFISHELSLTGAPRALLNMVAAAKRAGATPVLVSPMAGPMEKEINELGIPLFILSSIWTRSLFGDKTLNRFLAAFDKIVFNTLITVPLVKHMSYLPAQKICWLHEGKISYYLCVERWKWNLSELFSAFDQVYAVGNYAASFAAAYLPADKPVKQLLYGIPDEAVGVVRGATVVGEVDTRKVNLLFPGTITRRKGHRVLLKTLKYLPRDVRKQLVIYMAGAPAKRRIARQIEHCSCSCIRYLGELNHDDLLKLYPWMDGVLCPSLDDPMPIVCTEAMMFSKPVVVTDCTGTAALVEDGVSGFVIPAGSPRKLAKALKQVCGQKDRLPAMGRQARRIYEADFTMEIFQKHVEKLLDLDGNVS